MKRVNFRRVTACVAFCALSVAAVIFSAPATAAGVRESYIVLAQDNSAALTISNAMSDGGLSVESTQLGAVDFVEVMLTATQAATWSQFAGVRNIEVNQKFFLPGLNGLRAFAALSVILSHYFCFVEINTSSFSGSLQYFGFCKLFPFWMSYFGWIRGLFIL